MWRAPVRFCGMRGPLGTILESLESRCDTLRALASQGAADLIASRTPPSHAIVRVVLVRGPPNLREASQDNPIRAPQSRGEAPSRPKIGPRPSQKHPKRGSKEVKKSTRTTRRAKGRAKTTTAPPGPPPGGGSRAVSNNSLGPFWDPKRHKNGAKNNQKTNSKTRGKKIDPRRSWSDLERSWAHPNSILAFFGLMLALSHPREP